MFCKSCGAQNEDERIKCVACGEYLTDTAVGQGQETVSETAQQAKAASDQFERDTTQAQDVAQDSVKDAGNAFGSFRQEAEDKADDVKSEASQAFNNVRQEAEKKAENVDKHAPGQYQKTGFGVPAGDGLRDDVDAKTAKAANAFNQAADQAESSFNQYGSNQGQQNPYGANQGQQGQQGQYGANQGQQNPYGANQGQQNQYGSTPGYGPQGTYSQANYQTPAKKDQTLSLVSMILGIVAIIFTCCFAWLAVPLGIGAVVTGILAIKGKKDGRGMAMAGIICGGLGIILGITFGILGSILMKILKESADSYTYSN